MAPCLGSSISSPVSKETARTVNDSPGPSNESGQSLSVTAVSATSVQGGAVVLSGGTITYTPPAQHNGPDSFSYTVTDNGTTNGAADPLSATGAVNVTVTAVNDAPTLNPIADLGQGSFHRGRRRP